MTAGSSSVRILPRALHVVGLASLRTLNPVETGRSSVDTPDLCLYNHFKLPVEAKPLRMNIFGARSLPTSPVCSSGLGHAPDPGPAAREEDWNG